MSVSIISSLRGSLTIILRTSLDCGTVVVVVVVVVEVEVVVFISRALVSINCRSKYIFKVCTNHELLKMLDFVYI